MALPLTAIYLLGATPFDMGLLRAAGFVPYLLFGFLGATLIDRSAKRPVMIGADIARALLLLSIPLAAMAHALSLPQLLTVAFAVGAAGMAFNLANSAYVPAVVGREALLDANSKLQQTSSLTGIAGPGLGGALVQSLSAPLAIVFDAISFLWSAAVVGLIRWPETGAGSIRKALLAEALDGVTFTWQNSALRAQLLSTGMFNLFVSGGSAVAMLFLVTDLHLNAAAIGLAFSLGAPGALVGAFMAKPSVARLGVGRSMIASSAIGGGSIWLLVASGQHVPALFVPALVAASLFLMGLGNQVFNICAMTLRQAVTPRELLARVNASSQFVTLGIAPMGALLGGSVASLVGLRGALTIAAAGSSLAFCWLLWSPVRTLREISASNAEA